MQDNLQPLIHKAAVTGLRVNVTRAGLCINDPAELHLLPDGQIGIFAQARKGFLGLFRPKALLHLGQLGPTASALIATAIQDARHLRVRIVGLTPEHLAPTTGAEVWISVWGDASGLTPLHLGPKTHRPDDTTKPARHNTALLDQATGGA
jgi:hypothetical protein